MFKAFDPRIARFFLRRENRQLHNPDDCVVEIVPRESDPIITRCGSMSLMSWASCFSVGALVPSVYSMISQQSK